MLSTGREFDRIFIAMLIIALSMLAIYTFKTCNNLEQKQLASSNLFEQRVSYMTSQLSDTKQHVDTWLAGNKDASQVENETPPAPHTEPEPMPYGA